MRKSTVTRFIWQIRALVTPLAVAAATGATGGVLGYYAGISALPIVGAIFSLLGALGAAWLSAKASHTGRNRLGPLSTSLLVIVFVGAHVWSLNFGIAKRLASVDIASPDWFSGQSDPVVDLTSLPQESRLAVLMIYKKMHALGCSPKEVEAVLRNSSAASEHDLDGSGVTVMQVMELQKYLDASSGLTEEQKRYGTAITERIGDTLYHGRARRLDRMLALLNQEISLHNELVDAASKQAFETKITLRPEDFYPPTTVSPPSE